MIFISLGVFEDRLHKCLTVEPTSVLVMGNGTSTASSRKHSSSRRTQAHRPTWLLVPAATLEGACAGQTSWSTSQLIQTLSGKLSAIISGHGDH